MVRCFWDSGGLSGTLLKSWYLCICVLLKHRNWLAIAGLCTVDRQMVDSLLLLGLLCPWCPFPIQPGMKISWVGDCTHFML